MPNDMSTFVILTSSEQRALNAVACAGEDFEPFIGRLINSDVLMHLMATGLVEDGPSCRPAVGDVGYRLTVKGWGNFESQVFDGR